jgi:DNA repair exonuclease SbcCD nuclease subunit
VIVLLDNFQKTNEREMKKRLNEFIVDFEGNMEVLQSMTSLFEERTAVEIEKNKNSILELLNTNISTKTKSDLIMEKLKTMNTIITNSFTNLKEKLRNYENLSNQKIAKTRSFFEEKLQKFLK